jgi:hypothetical protein
MKKDDFPRRNKLWLMVPAETVIYLAMQEVEKLGADVKLTNAVCLLAKAKDLVSDFIDNVKIDYNTEHDIHYYKCPECGQIQMTSKESPYWLIQQVTILQLHKHKVMEIPCRVPYVEITEKEFTDLTFKRNEETVK